MHLARRDGFSIIEVLAAVALISVAIVPLFQFQRTLTDAVVSIERNVEALEISRSALALVSTINPAKSPDGCDQLGEWSVCWASERIAFEADADGFLGQSSFAIGLYEITITISIGSYQKVLGVRQLGWVLIRDPLELFR